MRAYSRCEEREAEGIDGVGLCEPAGALGEVPGLPGIGDDDGNTGCSQGSRSGKLEAPRGFEYN